MAVEMHAFREQSLALVNLVEVAVEVGILADLVSLVLIVLRVMNYIGLVHHWGLLNLTSDGHRSNDRVRPRLLRGLIIIKLVIRALILPLLGSDALHGKFALHLIRHNFLTHINAILLAFALLHLSIGCSFTFFGYFHHNKLSLGRRVGYTEAPVDLFHVSLLLVPHVVFDGLLHIIFRVIVISFVAFFLSRGARDRLNLRFRPFALGLFKVH